MIFLGKYKYFQVFPLFYEEKMTDIANIATEQQKTGIYNQTQGYSGNSAVQLKRKSQLNKLITSANGTPDYLAICIYWDTLRSWYTPNKLKIYDGSVVEIAKLKTKGIYFDYNKLVSLYSCSKETIRKKLVKLEKLGLIQRGFKHRSTSTTKSYNQMIIYVWKDTPHFTNKYGVDQDSISELKPQTNHKYIAEKYNINYQAKYQSSQQKEGGGGIHTLEGTKELIEPFNKLKDRSIKSNFNLENLKEKKEEEFVSNQNNLISTKQIDKSNFGNKIKSFFFSEQKSLSDFYPLSLEDCNNLQLSSDREFNLNAMNEILLNMSKKLTKHKFGSKKRFMAYMTKAFRNEKRDAVVISNATFKIRGNQSKEEQTIQIQEKYLTELEYSLQASPEWHLKKKLASVLGRSKAYDILTAYKELQLKQGGKCKLILSKHLALTQHDKEIILNQIQATHEGVGGIKSIKALEIETPEKQPYTMEKKLPANTPIFPDTLWGRIRSSIAKTIGGDGVAIDKNWFSKLDAKINEESRIITLKAPSKFFAEWIEQNYQETLNVAIKDYGFNLQSIS